MDPTKHLSRLKNPASKDAGFFVRSSFNDTTAEAGAKVVSPNVNEVYHAVQTLTDAERDELWQLMEARAGRQGDSAKPHPPNAIALADEERKRHRRHDFQPIELPGGPLSHDIIRDRR